MSARSNSYCDLGITGGRVTYKVNHRRATSLMLGCKGHRMECNGKETTTQMIKLRPKKYVPTKIKFATGSPELHLTQNGTESSEMDSNREVQQETSAASVSEQPPTYQATDTTQDDEIYIKEEPLWYNETSMDSNNGKKESESEKQGASKVKLSLESARLPSGAVYVGKNTSQRPSVSHSLNSNTESPQVYKCDFCTKCYKQNSGLKNHKLFFSCEICKKCFIKKPDLKNHVRLHTDTTEQQNEYQCNGCEKVFARKSALQSHKLMCQGPGKMPDLPYKCDVCEKHFTQELDLKTHKTFHKTKRYKCDICQKSFAWFSVLKEHITLHSIPHS